MPMPKEYRGLLNKQRKPSEADLAIASRYGDAKKFAERFNPDIQKYCAENIDKTFTADTPTINALRSAYNDKQVKVWIIIQIENLNQFAGTQNKMEPPQMSMLADIIMAEYGYLKAPELLLFFHRFKAGKYGQLYGSVDPFRVTAALVEFARYRRETIFEIEKTAEKAERDERIREFEMKHDKKQIK